MNTNKKQTYFVTLSLLVALILLLGLTPIGMIPLGFCKVTLLAIPVVVGTMMLGLKSGLVLGLAFGCVSVISAVWVNPSGNALAFTLFGKSWTIGVLVCVLPRLAVPVAAYLSYRVGQRWRPTAAHVLGGICGSVTNTLLYLGAMWISYTSLPTLDASKVVGIILGVGAIAGTCEAIAAGIVCPAIMKALEKVRI